MLSVFVSACGKQPQVVTGIQVTTSNQESDVFLAFKADLDLGAMQFPSVILPIIHPESRVQIGSVELGPVLGGKNQIQVSANLSALTNLRTSIADLPNGNMVPLIAQNPTITIPLGSGAELYLTLGANAVALGVAVPIQQFDSIGGSVGNVNLFPVFMVDQVRGAAGIFTGSRAGQNGFAIIADVTNYVNMQDIFVPQFAANLVASRSLKSTHEELEQISLDYSSQKPSSSKVNRINTMIYNLNQKKTKLRIK